MNTSIIRTSFREFCKAEGVTAIHNAVRVNSNGYPFITILRGSDAENIYFSKKASSEVSEGVSVKGIAHLLFTNSAVNAQGETRIKLSFAGDSYYLDIDDMF